MDNKISLPLSCNLIIVFVIVIFPVSQSEAPVDEANQIGTEEASTQAGADSTSSYVQRVSNADNQGLYAQISEDLECLALNIYFEARSESTLGRRAVGHVVMNRVNDSRFPNAVCDVVRQGGSRTLNQCQFSWWCDGRSDEPYNRAQWLKSLQLAFEIYTGDSEDPTGGALWYHADYTDPNWSRAFHRGPKIGHHIFYRKSLTTASVL